MTERIDFYEVVARRKLGVPPEWRWCNIKAVGPDTVVEGGIPRLLKSGKRKGKLTWRDCKLEPCVVTTAEIEAARAEYERSSGNCWVCQGTKLEFASWDHVDGTKNRECSQCNGTGLSEAERKRCAK